jgi:sarcosine oxidase subunit beta
VGEFDVIIIGAGSIGVPAAAFVAEKGYRVLVIERNSGPGQGLNSRAIGGVRATHSSLAKAAVARESIEVYSSWLSDVGDDIGWYRGGYLFPAYTEDTAASLQEIAKNLRRRGFEANWLSSGALQKKFSWIDSNNITGGLHSPLDGRANPKKANAAFFQKSLALGTQFHFNERVVGINSEAGRVTGVATGTAEYEANFVIDAAGPLAKQVGEMAGVNLPIVLEPHTAGRVAVVPSQYVDPLVIDLRPSPGTAMFYFFQDLDGTFVFTIDPEKPVGDRDLLASIVAERMQMIFRDTLQVDLTEFWSGVYPTTPDGTPIVSTVPNLDGFMVAAGMGGQGFMLGPGVGRLLARMINNSLTPADEEILSEFALDRSFSTREALK